jgi:hypothetical protein
MLLSSCQNQCTLVHICQTLGNVYAGTVFRCRPDTCAVKMSIRIIVLK